VSTIRARMTYTERGDETVLTLPDGRLAVVLDAEGWALSKAPAQCRVCRGWTSFLAMPGRRPMHPICFAPVIEDIVQGCRTEWELEQLDAVAASAALPTMQEATP